MRLIEKISYYYFGYGADCHQFVRMIKIEDSEMLKNLEDRKMLMKESMNFQRSFDFDEWAVVNEIVDKLDHLSMVIVY